MTSRIRIDSVGWKFFTVVWLLILGPTAYWIWENTLHTTPAMLRGGSALFLAGMVAAVISWLANCILGFIVGEESPDAPDEEE